MLDLRDAEARDLGFLAEMLAVAADWRPDAHLRPADDILRVPEFAHYLVGWPQPGDRGVVAGVVEPIGAAWFRFLTLADQGYGYVADDVPEITVGVRRSHRGRGVGTAVLRRLVERAREADLSAVSLSVEEDNPATRLYQRLGFVAVDHADGAVTMLLRLR